MYLLIAAFLLRTTHGEIKESKVENIRERYKRKIVICKARLERCSSREFLAYGLKFRFQRLVSNKFQLKYK